MITAVIIDNEPKSVFTLRSFLEANCRDVQVAGSANDAKSGRELIEELRPQLVFLDIEMPRGSGFDLLHSLSSVDFEIIFVTAYNQYALDAFKFSAVDYLLKPVKISMLTEAVARAAARIQEKKSVKNYELLLRNLDEQDAAKRKIALTDRGEQYLVQVDEIAYLAGSSNYTHIVTGKKTFLSTKRLKDFEDLLPADIFCRIHNSHIVNMKFIAKVQKGRGGNVVMQDGTVLEIAFRRKEHFMEVFLGRSKG